MKTSRREALKLLGVTPLLVGSRWAEPSKIRQSVCRWCYPDLTLDRLSEAARRIGLESVELIGPEEYATVKEFGLTCAMAHGTGPIHDCLNRVENHPRCLQELEKAIAFARSEGLPNVICFSGNRNGMDDEEGLSNCAAALKKIAPLAESSKVTVCLELLNSRVDHKDYMADSTDWGVRLIRTVGSERVKLLYDIYHMQIMEGDVIRTIRRNHEYFGHYHTGGVPGRHEIDHTQELNYPAIVRAIRDTGYRGFIGQEFIPSRDPLSSLQEAFRLCTV